MKHIRVFLVFALCVVGVGFGLAAPVPDPVLPSMLRDVEFFVVPNNVCLSAAMKVGQVEESYLVKIRFRRWAIVGTPLGNATKALMDGAVVTKDGWRSGDYRYAVKMIAKEESDSSIMYIDRLVPVGSMNGRLYRLEKGSFEKFKKCIEDVAKGGGEVN